jgi:tripartite-type tricarboxylate transporter receptor subunit TctC
MPGLKLLKIISIRSAAAVCGVLFAQLVFAQAYPGAKPVTLIVPFAVGGGTDIVARIMAEKMRESLKANVVVENKPGASAQIGNKYVIDAAPDGYTLLVGTTSLINGAALFPNLPYDAARQLRPVVSLADLPIFLSISTQKYTAKTLREFVDTAKKTPNLNYGSAGAGTTLHMSAEWFKTATGIQAAHIPFKGSGPEVVALGGGQVDFAMENLGAVQVMVQSGRVRLLGVASPARHPQAPDVPTFKEAGLPDVNLATWIFLMAPAATPDAVVALLNRTLNDILRQPDTRDKLLAQGFVHTGGTIEEMTQRMKTEADLWGTVIKNANIKLD